MGQLNHTYTSVCMCDLIAHMLGQFQERERTGEIKHGCHLKLVYGLLFALDHNNIQNSSKYVGNILQYSALSVQNNFSSSTPSWITSCHGKGAWVTHEAMSRTVRGHPRWTCHSEEF